MLLAVAFTVLVASLWQSPREPTVAPDKTSSSNSTSPPKSVDSLAERQARERQRRQEFFQGVVTANLTAAQQANEDAAQRCLTRIASNFDRYRKGVDPFVDDVLGLRTRLGLLKRMPGDWWSGDERVKQYIVQKFEQHLFSEQSLTADLRIALEAFQAEVHANQRALLVDTQAAIDQSDLPPIQLDDYETFFAAVTQQINDLAREEAKTSVREGLTTLVVSEAGSAVVGMIAARLVTSIAASSTAAVATTGGAAASGAAAGAAGGSFVPGAGTIAGFVAGLVVGLGIDFWMTNQTAEKLQGELIQYIQQIESDLMHGPKSSDNAQQDQGIQAGLQNACRYLNQSVTSRMREIIVEETRS